MNLLSRLALVLLIFVAASSHAQQVHVQGTVKDTAANKPLQHAVAMMIRLNDSLLTTFTRTNEDGFFRMDPVPADTYHVIISHPSFGDQSFILLGNAENDSFDLQQIILPPKSITLTEVTVFGYSDPVYYKGDTLVYIADSFKVKQNAVVEDLLKKLPGIKVDQDGKIYSQGKAVDQVLVDGDEFFGSDPTVATKNLAATSVESVQVYDKKNEDAAQSDDKETLKVMDLKLKEDSKKGYFGKISLASDFHDYYEGEFLANKFKGKQKISIFGLVTNTPRSRFDWNDMWKYGIDDGVTREYGEDGGMYMYSTDDRNQGIPRTLKGGFYYTDKPGKNTKVSLNYAYADATLDAFSETSSRYFLTDTTYKTNKFSRSSKDSQKHSPNLSVIQTLDSLTELELTSKLKYTTGRDRTFESTSFLTDEDSLTRTTLADNSRSTSNYDWNNSAKLTRSFSKKDRKLTANYSVGLIHAESDGILLSDDTSLPDSASVNQKKNTLSDRQTHNGSISFTEPVTKRIKLEFSYDVSLSSGRQTKKTFDFVNGEYNSENDTLSNDFESIRHINRLGTRFTYEVKKYSLSLGARLRQVYAQNHNLGLQQELSHTVNNVLPYLTYRYKFSDNKQFSIRYTTNSNQPDLNQLQPVPDNTNPNFIVKGNPDLLPTYSHNFYADMYSWALLSGRHLWSSAGYTTTQHAFSNNVEYDTSGRTISQPINVEGNYNAYTYLGIGFNILNKLIQFEPNLNFNYSHSVNYINSEKNITRNFTSGGDMDIKIETDTIEIHLGGGLRFNEASSSLNTASNESYYTTNYKASVEFTFPAKFKLETNAEYYRNYKREESYNLNYLLWNASLTKTLLKNENLLLSVSATDILNENINTTREVRDNVISDIKTNLVGRYLLFKVLFKFNSNKEKDEGY